MNNIFVNQVALSDDESNLNMSQQSYNREYFKLTEYVPFKQNQIVNIQKCVSISEDINDKVKDCHQLMIHKDVDFYTQHIDDMYVIGTDLFNMIEIINQYEITQKQELNESKERQDKMEIYINETSNQKKYYNINIQEVELDAMFEEMKELENERIGLAEGFDPLILGSISIPDIDDSLNLVFLWCTIALYGNYKEDYYWENFKEQVLRKDSVEDFVQRLLYKKASKMTRDQSFIAEEILNKKEEFLIKKYLKKKQIPQLEKLFLFIKNVNECWIISQEIRIKVLYFDQALLTQSFNTQIQKEFLELEVLKTQHEAEKLIYQDKLKQFELTIQSLNETKKYITENYTNFSLFQQLENQLTEIVELQQNGEQYLLRLHETQKKYFPYYDKVTIGQRVQELEDIAFGNNTPGNNQNIQSRIDQNTYQHERDSQFLLNQDVNSLDGQTIPTVMSANKLQSRIKPFNFEKKNSQDGISIGESNQNNTPTKLNQFEHFDAEAELDKSVNSGDENEEEDEDEEQDQKGKKKDDCNIF